MAWLILHIHDRSFKVAARLGRDGHKTFHPGHWVQIDGRGKNTVRWRDLYPGYLFLAFTPKWPSAQRTDGVVGVLKASEDSPHVVSDEIVDALRVIPDMSRKECHNFQAGDIVCINAGPSEGLIGEYHASLSNGEVSTILLTFMNGTRKVRIRTDLIEATPPAGQSAQQPKSA